MKHLYELDSRLDATGSGVPHPSCGTEEEICCDWCGAIRREHMPRPLWAVMSEIVPGAAMNSADEPAIKVFHLALLEHFPSLADHIRGPVTMHDGRETEYATLYTLNPLVIRGGKDTGFCPECGQWYRDESAKKPYVLRSNLLEGRDFFQTEMSRPIISARLKDRIPWDEFPDILLHRIAIRDRAPGTFPRAR
jgi:hypothetical protein